MELSLTAKSRHNVALILSWLQTKLPGFLQAYFERILSSPLASRLLKGAFWVSFGSVISRGLGLLASVAVARILGKEKYGEIGIVQNTVVLLTSFAGLGLGMAATKFIAEYRNLDPSKAGRILALASAVTLATSGAASLLLLLAAPWVSAHALSAPHLTVAVRIGAVLLFFSGVNSVQINALSGFEAFRAIARINIICGAVTFPCMLGGTYYWGLAGSLWASVLVAALNCLLTQVALREECRRNRIIYHYYDFWPERGILLSFALPIFVCGVSGTCADWILNATLVKQPNGFSELGLFNAARQWNTLILFVPGMLAGLTLPVLSNLRAEGNVAQFKKMLVFNSLILFAAALAVAAPAAIFAKPAMGLYGLQFADGWPILLINCVYCILYASSIVVGQAMWSMNLVKEALAFAIARSLLILLLWNLLKGRLATGMAWSYCLTFLIQTIVLIPYVWWRANRLFRSVKQHQAIPISV